MDQVITALRTALTWELNGLLALLYVAWEHVALLITAGACGWLLWGLPAGHREGGASQRPWLLGVGILVSLAAAFAPAPVPILLAAMTVAGTLAVRADRFNPDALRWRITGGLALYAAAALAYLAYGGYLNGLDAAAWAEAIGGQGEAQAALAQGRAFVSTLATWGLWLILPLGYFSLLAQGVLVHPPLPARPDETITAVRTRGRG
jgi:hypothetical protein